MFRYTFICRYSVFFGTCNTGVGIGILKYCGIGIDIPTQHYYVVVNPIYAGRLRTARSHNECKSRLKGHCCFVAFQKPVYFVYNILKFYLYQRVLLMPFISSQGHIRNFYSFIDSRYNSREANYGN